jgi:hypothetical protein
MGHFVHKIRLGRMLENEYIQVVVFIQKMNLKIQKIGNKVIFERFNHPK